jgi:glycosyltransferase involved in cell wall biosynthesis
MKSNSLTVGINASFSRKPETGIGQVTLNFLRKLSRFKINEYKFILYLEEDLPKNFKLPENFEKHIFLPLWKRDDLIRKIWWEKYLLPKHVQKDNCDVYISMYQCPTVLKGTSKHLMIVHDIIPKLFPRYLNNSRKKVYWKLTEKGIRKADVVMAVSKKTKEDLIGKMKIPENTISVNHIDVDEIFKDEISGSKGLETLAKYNLNPGYIFAGGGMEIRKNIEGVVKAYKYLLDQNEKEKFIPKIPTLVIYGKLLPELAPLTTDAEKLINELNIKNEVKLLGLVPQNDMPALFKNALMFVYPSLYEGFGIPPLEAMNLGVPVILSDRSSLPEVGGENALYCHPEDISDIASAMKKIMLDEGLHKTLSNLSKERANQFSWDKFTEKVLNIVEKLK